MKQNMAGKLIVNTSQTLLYLQLTNSADLLQKITNELNTESKAKDESTEKQGHV